MVGPSSSHTAGVCRIGWAVRKILGGTPQTCQIGLHGSLYATGQGHGTDQAIVAGLLGLAPDDTRLKNSFELAKAAGLQFEIGEIDLGPQSNPNSAELYAQRGETKLIIRAASVGGGSILIQKIDPFLVEIRGTLETLILWHADASGFLASITSILAGAELNVATIRTSRYNRGERALTTVEIDGTFPCDVLSVIGRIHTIERLACLPILPGF